MKLQKTESSWGWEVCRGVSENIAEPKRSQARRVLAEHCSWRREQVGPVSCGGNKPGGLGR